MTRARAFWTVAPGEGEIRAEMPPGAAAGQMLMRTLASGVSRVTEPLIFAGHVPSSQHEAMRAADGWRVFVLHPHQDVVLAPEEMCVSIPDAVPTQRAVLAANMETALNLMWNAAPLAGCAMAVAEALARGLLIAASAGGEPASLVPIAAGIMSSPGVPEHLSKPLRQVIPGPAPRRQMANVACAAGRALASWSTQTKAFADALAADHAA